MKYRGPADLAKFECTGELDSGVVKRVCYNATNVIMESNPHQLELADKPTLEQILAVPGGSEFVGGNGRIYAEKRDFGVDQDAFLIARSEDSTCDGEYCPTAFISLDGAKSKIVGLGWLPRRVLYGDVTFDFCRVCGRLYGLSFMDTKDHWTTIAISRNYLVIHGNVRSLA